MPIYMSLLIDGIEGDGSVNLLHKGEINVISFSWGISTGEAASGGGGGTGKAQFDDLVIVKQMDQASPRLMLACSSGRHSKFALFKIVSTNEDGRPSGNNVFLKMEDVVVESVRQMGHENGGDFPTEQITLDGARVSVFQVGPATGNQG